MDKDRIGLEDVCKYIKASKDLWNKEEELDVGHNYSTIYSRRGCYQCSGGFEMKDSCRWYYVELKTEEQDKDNRGLVSWD